MNGSDIFFILKDNPLFGGVLSRDHVARAHSGKIYVFNTDVSSGPGTHWVVIDRTYKSSYFFDSFGFSSTHYKFPKISNYSKQQVQSRFFDTCGLYTIFYVHCRAKKQSPKRILSVFSKNLKNNDKYIIKWVSSLSG